MNNGTDLRVNQSLELLTSLKQTAAKFAKREEQLARELNSHRYQANRRSQEALASATANSTAHIAQIHAYFQAEAERINAIYHNRRVRIQRLYTTKLRNLPGLADEAQRRWVGEFQMRNHVAQKKLAAADETYTSRNSELETLGVTRRSLERNARSAFGGYWTLKKMLRGPSGGTASTSGDPLEELRGEIANAEQQLAEFRKLALPRLFSFLPLPLLLVLTLAGAGALAWILGLTTTSYAIAGAAAAVFFGGIWFVHHLGLSQAKPLASTLAASLVKAKAIIEEQGPAIAASNEQERQQAQAEFEQTTAEIQRQWEEGGDVKTNFEQKARTKLDAQAPRLFEKVEAILGPKLQRIEADRAAHLAWTESEAANLTQQITETHAAETAALVTGETTHWDAIQADWHREMTPIYEAINTMNAVADSSSPPWGTAFVEAWTPPITFTHATRFGHLDLDLTKQANSIPKDPRLALPGPAQVTVPLALTYPDQGSLLLETSESAGALALGTLNNIALRLLTTTPPGKIAFTIIDPIGLGQSFAGLMHLSDYEDSLINRRIWTQRDQIEERLLELSEHIEKVIQMYLRNEYATITDYNEKAGSVAEKYLFLIVADFPSQFSELAARRLQSIAMSGPRCGIFTLIDWDKRQPLPEGFLPDELRKNSVCIRRTGADFVLGKAQTELGATLTLDAPPDPDLAVSVAHKVGKSSIDSNRVQVPFTQITPPNGELWQGDTTQELRIAVGRTGATKLQYLAIGKGTRQHALFAGKTGSGKSTLFHVIITNLALTCSPEMVEFYLIDFKKGVEFKCYASKHLPHAKVVAIESDREFALSVLQRVDAELKRRGDMFRKLGAQDVAGYKRLGGTEPMPRSLLLIDEFQEFFVQDDPVAQSASLLFDRIVRQGRAFGIHVLLGSQTLGGAYSLARATLGQMAIRVALQCNEADAYLIMDENNPAPRLLSRPGEGIYNDAAGAMEGNSPFQVVWLSDQERDACLEEVRTLADEKYGQAYPGPIVFEGNAPSDIRENHLLRNLLDSTPTASPVASRCWLGAPNSIKGPTEAVFQRQSGNHMLVVGQRDEAILTMVGVSMLALAAQYPQGGAKFVLLQLEAPGSPEALFLEQIVKSIHQEIVMVNTQNVGTAINDIATELKTRAAAEMATGDTPAIYLFVLGLQKFKKLRHEDDFSFSSGGDAGPDPGAQFNEIITEGSAVGIHLITTVDTLNSVNRFMNRKALTEFEKRIIFQMSANDSASLIDSPKAGDLGLHRALYYNEHEGSTETFRPYAMPDSGWLREAAEKLARQAGVAASHITSLR